MFSSRHFISFFPVPVKTRNKQVLLSASVQDKAQKVINNYTSIYTAKRGEVQNLQIIGVHIRRGDYLLPEKIKYGYNIVTKKYIDNAFQYFRKRTSSPLMFSSRHFISFFPVPVKTRNKQVLLYRFLKY
jgi:hypothetical protein